MGGPTEHIAAVESPKPRPSVIHPQKTKEKNKSKASLFALLMLSLNLRNSHKCFNKNGGNRKKPNVQRGVGLFSFPEKCLSRVRKVMLFPWQPASTTKGFQAMMKTKDDF